MYNNQISAFEYVSILVSIILGLGITQVLASFSDLLYDYKKIRVLLAAYLLGCFYPVPSYTGLVYYLPAKR